MTPEHERMLTHAARRLLAICYPGSGAYPERDVPVAFDILAEELASVLTNDAAVRWLEENKETLACYEDGDGGFLWSLLNADSEGYPTIAETVAAVKETKL